MRRPRSPLVAAEAFSQAQHTFRGQYAHLQGQHLALFCHLHVHFCIALDVAALHVDADAGLLLLVLELRNELVLLLDLKLLPAAIRQVEREDDISTNFLLLDAGYLLPQLLDGSS